MRDSVEAYYGSVLATSDDLKTNACTPSAAPPPHLRPLLAAIHPEISGKSYGCGLVYPPLLENARVLDLGCGTGRDCYVLSQMVGENGHVVGVDMTDEQLEVAEKYLDVDPDQSTVDVLC